MEYTEKIQTNTTEFNYLPVGLRQGIIAGALMGLYLFGLKWLGYDISTTFKFVKYLILFGVIFMMLRRYRSFFPPMRYFRSGILLGLVTSAVAAITLLLINGFSFVVGGGELALQKFGATATGFGSFMLIEGVIFFEVLVYGMISTFISLQALKFRNDYEPGKR